VTVNVAPDVVAAAAAALTTTVAVADAAMPLHVAGALNVKEAEPETTKEGPAVNGAEHVQDPVLMVAVSEAEGMPLGLQLVATSNSDEVVPVKV
jgi:Asp-tRNA(Asn)/Glu-tRNA(Gln) amidotransferase A subunit family amidase